VEGGAGARRRERMRLAEKWLLSCFPPLRAIMFEIPFGCGGWIASSSEKEIFQFFRIRQLVLKLRW